MVSRCLTFLVAATTVLARTPAGFTPATQNDLIVEYNGFAALNGAVVSKSVTTSQPRIGTLARLTGTSYAVMMIDLDIPTNTPPQTNTLLHWMQTDLTPSTTATQLNTTSGTMRVFLLENKSNTSALASYIGPNPPARVPLSHRYTQVLVDTSGMAAQGVQALQTAAKTRMGFEAEKVLVSVGLEGKVVAGNSFNVTNPGPVMAANGTTGGGGGSRNGGGGSRATGTGVGGGRPSQTGVVTGPGAVVRPGSALVGGAVVAGMVLLGL